mmetsp:Transcript_60135/g.161328  ORF Transcript_60135/g.161328 Transcript_60135/m.161328 type:complete len:212 (+) Transcript_60135:1193-1828(+)
MPTCALSAMQWPMSMGSATLHSKLSQLCTTTHSRLRHFISAKIPHSARAANSPPLPVGNMASFPFSCNRKLPWWSTAGDRGCAKIVTWSSCKPKKPCASKNSLICFSLNSLVITYTGISHFAPASRTPSVRTSALRANMWINRLIRWQKISNKHLRDGRPRSIIAVGTPAPTRRFMPPQRRTTQVALSLTCSAPLEYQSKHRQSGHCATDE